MHVWDWFQQVGRARPISQVGFLPITWESIRAWADLMRIRPKPWELEILLRLDDLWLSIQSRKGVTMDDLKGADDGLD